MVEYKSASLDAVFHALSDSTRREMLIQMTSKPCSISELAEPHDLTFAAISKHLKVLEAANFVERTRDGRTYFCRANLTPLNDVQTLLEQLGVFWRSALSNLDKFLATIEQKDTAHDKLPKKRRLKSRGKKKNQGQTRDSL